MKKQILTTILSIILIVGGIATASTITEILGTDTILSSRAVINTNFTNLNGDKIENSTTFAVSTSSNAVSIGTSTISTTLSVVGSSTFNGNVLIYGTTTIATSVSGALKASSGVISSSTNLITRTVNIAFTDATTSANRVDMFWNPGQAITLIQLDCISDGTMIIDFGETTATSLSTSSEIAAITCDTDNASTTAFADSAIASDSRIKGRITSITNGTSSYATFKYIISP